MPASRLAVRQPVSLRALSGAMVAGHHAPAPPAPAGQGPVPTDQGSAARRGGCRYRREVRLVLSAVPGRRAPVPVVRWVWGLLTAPSVGVVVAGRAAVPPGLPVAVARRVGRVLAVAVSVPPSVGPWVGMLAARPGCGPEVSHQSPVPLRVAAASPAVVRGLCRGRDCREPGHSLGRELPGPDHKRVLLPPERAPLNRVAAGGLVLPVWWWSGALWAAGVAMAAAPVPIPAPPQRRAGRAGERRVWRVRSGGRGQPQDQRAFRHPLVRDWALEPVFPPPAVSMGRSLGLPVSPTAAALPIPAAASMEGCPGPGKRTSRMRGWWEYCTAPDGPDARRPGRVASPASPLQALPAGQVCRWGPVRVPAMAGRQHRAWLPPLAHHPAGRSEAARRPSRGAAPAPGLARGSACCLCWE